MKPSTNFAFLIIVLAIFSALVFSLAGQLVALRDPGSDGDSTTTSSDSGLEFINNELTIIRGCAESERLAWDEIGDEWECAGGVSEEVFSGTADASVTNTVVETTMIPTGVGSITIPANTLAVGSSVFMEAQGYYSTVNPGPGTLTLRFYLDGGAIISHVETLDANQTNEYWEYHAHVTVRTIGAAGTSMSQGVWEHANTAPAASWHAGATPNTTTSAIDTTAANTIDFTVQFSVADPANVFTLTNVALQLID